MTLNLSTLPLGTRLRTRDGRSARLLATDLRNSCSCVVAVDLGSLEVIHILTAGGAFYPYAAGNGMDIVSVEAAPRAMLDMGRDG